MLLPGSERIVWSGRVVSLNQCFWISAESPISWPINLFKFFWKVTCSILPVNWNCSKFITAEFPENNLAQASVNLASVYPKLHWVYSTSCDNSHLDSNSILQIVHFVVKCKYTQLYNVCEKNVINLLQQCHTFTFPSTCNNEISPSISDVVMTKVAI